MAGTVETRLNPTPPEGGENTGKKEPGKKIIAALAALGVVATGLFAFNSNQDKEAPLGSGPVAEAPANPGTENSVDSSSEIKPETLKALEAISLAQAEQESGITSDEILSYVDDTTNTPILYWFQNEATVTGSLRPPKGTEDPLAVVEKLAISKSDPGLLEQILRQQRITYDDLPRIYNWYSKNIGQIKSYQALPNLNVEDKALLWHARASLNVTASIIEEVVAGDIKLLNNYQETEADLRIKKLIDDYYGSEEELRELLGWESPVGEVFILTVNEEGNLDMNTAYPNNKMYLFNPFITVGSIGPYQSNAFSGTQADEAKLRSENPQVYDLLEIETSQYLF